jgi:hypothetical protein
MREYLLFKHAYRSAGKDASAKTQIHPCLQNFACPNILRSGGPQSVLDETCHRKKTVLTEEKLEGIQVWLQIISEMSRTIVTRGKYVNRLCF